MYAVCSVVTPRETFKDLIDHVRLLNNLGKTTIPHCIIVLHKKVEQFSLVEVCALRDKKWVHIPSVCIVGLGLAKES